SSTGHSGRGRRWRLSSITCLCPRAWPPKSPKAGRPASRPPTAHPSGSDSKIGAASRPLTLNPRASQFAVMKSHPNALMDLLFKNLTRAFAFLVFILLAAILASLVYGSRESIAAHGLAFLWTNEWDPVRNIYGALVPIVGTLLTSLIALIIA